jgi:hypothetical protein
LLVAQSAAARARQAAGRYLCNTGVAASEVTLPRFDGERPATTSRARIDGLDVYASDKSVGGSARKVASISATSEFVLEEREGRGSGRFPRERGLSPSFDRSSTVPCWANQTAYCGVESDRSYVGYVDRPGRSVRGAEQSSRATGCGGMPCWSCWPHGSLTASSVVAWDAQEGVGGWVAEVAGWACGDRSRGDVRRRGGVRCG